MSGKSLTIILAAGEGTRMRSAQPKVLHEIAGLSMLGHVLSAAEKSASGDLALIVGNQAEEVVRVAKAHAPQIGIYVQQERLGTAHAVLAAREALEGKYDAVLVVFGDTPLIRPQTLSRMREEIMHGTDVAVVGFNTETPDGYGRLLEQNGALVAIREHRDASPAEREISFCNGGIMAIRGDIALPLLDKVSCDNARGEYYLTDIVEIANGDGRRVVALQADETELIGVNTRQELAQAESLWQWRKREALMLQGVTMQAPETVFLSHDTQIDTDCVIEPNVWFGAGVSLGENVRIRAFSHLEGCRVEAGAIVGPYARLRPGTVLGCKARVGNFCEIKNANIAAGAKINHLSYIGDASIGKNANIGAGTITCNYDGVLKHLTEIGADAFIGSNSALVAPVRIGERAYVASGSVIVEDVADDALALARSRQVSKPGYAKKIRETANARKKAKT
jgi:bifunctional UDP-N-acetylglucosamine pyrophosphorylase / glucosamine-1-phosphate N-acetyltransferase